MERREEEQQKRDDSRFNQTLKNVQGFLKGRSIPGKVLLTRRPDPTPEPISPTYHRSLSENDAGRNERSDNPVEVEDNNSSKKQDNTYAGKLRSNSSSGEQLAKQVQNLKIGGRSSDHARVMKFNKVLSETTVILEKLRELAWSGVPHYMRPDVWRLLLGYAPPNSDRREAVLRRKRLEYLESVGQFYDLPDSERSDDEINMLRQIAVDCPRTVPDVSFFQQAQVQKSLERILYTWAIRHPASDVDSWSMSDLSAAKVSDVEADCYWCLTKLLDGMQDHYTFAQPGIQRLVFKLKELVRRIDEPVARHMEEQGLEFLQFAFRWYNCLLIREIPFSLINRLWDTYLAEGDALPDFLVYIYASFLLTWSDELKKLDFQEMVMFLQHLPTQTWTDQELEMVLSRAYMWHSCLVHRFLLFIIWLSSFQDVAAAHYETNEHTSKSTTAELANPPGIGVSGPIQVSPSVIPKYTSPALPWTPPMYPTFPDTYEPKLTGKCTADFQAISSIINTAASDCSQPFAALVGNVICCPQFVSLLHIFQGQHDVKSDKLVLPDAVATDCFSDIVSILVSKRANMTIPELCSVTSSNLTGGSCPVQDVATFEKVVNSSKLLDACRTVDPLKECCRPVCQGAIMEASLIISGHQTNGDKIPLGGSNNVNALNDCKNVVFSYISRKLEADKANTAFRILSSCKVNKACPLEFKEPTEVIKACRNVAAPSPSCCSSLNAYISGIRNQMLITNKQAIVCATVIGSMLRKGGVMTNIYELCDVDLKDFSVQGCLLRSYPADLIFDNTTGYSFTCDLTDNIAAPWPSSSSMSSLSLCAPEMSLPALPTSQTLRNHGFRGGGAFGALRLIIILVFMLYGVTIIHNLSFCSFNSIIIERKQRLHLSSFVTLPPTFSVQPRFCARTTNKQFVAVCAAPSDVETSSKDESVLITTVETGNSNEVKVHVEVSGEKTQTVFNTVFEKMVAAAQPIPGFRRVKGGKTPNIPREILLEILGYSKVYRQVIKKLINSSIEDYVKQEDLKVGKELSVEQSYEDLEETFEPGESFSFDATIKLQEAS
ncbi:hypothetical protein HID58_015813 [Brassica napus]|uniref:Rab-GAP TBC domain-containing protein n=1 Tax=Brassica napus TaxID=3708 RepID=A0ABQ8DL64_BRANA|nr:hypothetical protein HID58_015813 [Brassica napus]